MGISLVGGAAGQVTWPAKNTSGAAVTAGDVVMLDFDTERDGYAAIKPVVANAKDYKAPCGVVLGVAGQTFRDDEELMIGIRGVFRTKVEGTTDIVVEDLLDIVSGQHYLIQTASAGFDDSVATVAAAGLTPALAAVTAVAPADPTGAWIHSTNGMSDVGMTYSETILNAMGNSLLALAKHAFFDQVVADLGDVVTDLGVIKTLTDELKSDVNTNATALTNAQTDALTASKAKAIALAGFTDNSTGYINCYWLGQSL